MASDCTAKEKEPPTKEETSPSSTLPDESMSCRLGGLSTSDNKKEEEPSLSPSFTLSLLPDELVLSCLARVSRSDYRALSLVSKRYHSLVLSPELYRTRSLLGKTEKRLYVCLRKGYDQPPLWFILRREKSKTLAARFPPFSSQPPKRSSMVALDWGIYAIGGLIKRKPTSNVLFLDCRTNTWSKLPSMAVARSLPAAGVVDGKIYVFGGCEDNDSLNWGEVFDPKTQTWDTLVSMPDRKIRPKQICASLVIEEKVYAVENTWVESRISQSRGLYYTPSEGKWGIKNIDLKPHGPYLKYVYVMIDKLLYSWELLLSHYGWSELGKLYWCEKEEFKWKEVKGWDLKNLIPRRARFQKLSNFGENIVVFWCLDHEHYFATTSKIWCVEISLERRKEEDEVWGKIEWSNALTKLDHPMSDRGNMVSQSVSVNL